MKKKNNDEAEVLDTEAQETPIELTNEEKLINENRELNDKLLRLNAEIQNIRRRNSEEVSRMLKYEGLDFITKTIEVVDIFERALQTNTQSEELIKFLNGFKMIYDKFMNVLKENQVEEIECLNKEFDPNTMEAVMTEEVEGVSSNIVTSVMQKGYIYKDKVVRHAMVKVAQ